MCDETNSIDEVIARLQSLRSRDKSKRLHTTLGQDAGNVDAGGTIRDYTDTVIGYESGGVMRTSLGREIGSIGLDGTLRSPLGNSIGSIGLRR